MKTFFFKHDEISQRELTIFCESAEKAGVTVEYVPDTVDPTTPYGFVEAHDYPYVAIRNGVLDSHVEPVGEEIENPTLEKLLAQLA